MDKHIRKVRGLKLLKKSHKDIRRHLKDQHYPEIHGDKIWPSSYFIMDFLDENPLDQKARVLEIGCGWGLLGIHCARKYKARVLAVDADERVFPFLELHAKTNRVSIETMTARFQDIPAATFSRQDVMLGGDICFWEELVDPLFKTIKRAINQGVGTILIADPGRSTFLELARRCQKAFGAFLISYVIIDPSAHDGYILAIRNSRRK